jgi:hypothetical protein
MRSSITEVDGAAPAHPRSRLHSAVKGTVAADGFSDRSFVFRMSNEDFNIISFAPKLAASISAAHSRPRMGGGGVLFQPGYFFALLQE